MSADTRVPFAGPIQAVDMHAAISDHGPRFARRFSVDVAEDALLQLGPYAVAEVAKRIGEQVAYRHQADIEAAVQSYLRDRTWAEPIVRRAIRDSVHEVVRDMLLNTRLGDALLGRES